MWLYGFICIGINCCIRRSHASVDRITVTKTLNCIVVKINL